MLEMRPLLNRPTFPPTTQAVKGLDLTEPITLYASRDSWKINLNELGRQKPMKKQNWIPNSGRSTPTCVLKGILLFEPVFLNPSF